MAPLGARDSSEVECVSPFCVHSFRVTLSHRKNALQLAQCSKGGVTHPVPKAFGKKQ